LKQNNYFYVKIGMGQNPPPYMVKCLVILVLILQYIVFTILELTLIYRKTKHFMYLQWKMLTCSN